MAINEKRVTFSDVVTVHTYFQNNNSSPMDCCSQLVSERQRDEPHMINKESFKSDISEIFDQTFAKGVCIVVGNLGRHPYLLQYYLDVYLDPTKKVFIESDWWDHIAHVDVSYRYDGSADCDLLILLEPLVGRRTVDRPRNVKSVLVLTSLRPLHPTTSYPTRYVYFGNVPNILKTIRLYRCRQQPCNVVHLSLQPFCNARVPFFSQSNVSLNVSQCQSKQEIYFCVLNMIDCISNLNIKSWSITSEGPRFTFHVEPMLRYFSTFFSERVIGD